jgi:hypothetical protein
MMKKKYIRKIGSDYDREVVGVNGSIYLILTRKRIPDRSKDVYAIITMYYKAIIEGKVHVKLLCPIDEICLC